MTMTLAEFFVISLFNIHAYEFVVYFEMLTISANINNNHLHIVFVEKKVSNNMSNPTSTNRTMICWFFFINNMFPDSIKTYRIVTYKAKCPVHRQNSVNNLLEFIFR
jgi:hypothetical protein